MKVFGSSRVENTIQEIAFAAEVIYIPASKGNPGGLYDSNLAPISQAINHRGKTVRLSQPIRDKLNVDDLPIIESQLPYFFLGEVTPHFGHFLVESTARLWPLLHLLPGFSANYLFCGLVAPNWLFKKSYIQTIYNCFSLNLDNVVSYPEPCRLKNVFIAPPAFEIRRQGHHSFRQSLQFVGTSLAGELNAINNTNLTPLYLSKSKLDRGLSGITNETDIEKSLQKKGVDIWHPETVDLPTQIRELTRRKYIIGSVGSAFHSLLLCPSEKIVSGVFLGEQINSNYIIIDKLCQNKGTYISSAEAGIMLSKDNKLRASSNFGRNFVASDPDKVAGMLLDNLKNA